MEAGWIQDPVWTLGPTGNTTPIPPSFVLSLVTVRLDYTPVLSVLPSFISIQIPSVKCSVSFTDSVSCWDYMASVSGEYAAMVG